MYVKYTEEIQKKEERIMKLTMEMKLKDISWDEF